MLVRSKINGYCMGYDLFVDREIDLPEDVIAALGDDVEVLEEKKPETKQQKAPKNKMLTEESEKVENKEV